MHESCHICMSHVSHEQVMSYICIMAHMNKVMSHMNEVMSYINESCHMHE